MSNVYLLLLAFVQGVTEFLPISSSAHLNLLSLLSDFATQPQIINVAVHCGSMFAVILYFRRDIIGCFYGGLDIIQGKNTIHSQMIKCIVIASPPVFFLGAIFIFFDIVDLVRTLFVIAVVNFIFALLLWYADRQKQTRQNITQYDSVMIGLAQALAVIPGVSRSGITMTMARYRGIESRQAARFSMLLSVPVISAATIVESIKWQIAGESHYVARVDLVDVGMVIIFSFAAAYVSIAFMLRILEKIGFMPFIIYRILLSVILFFFIIFT